ncbi:MAG: RNA 2',3'-cyclic phosphodiesterase [Ruminococcaceae bacterium]|jgi:2'-5' RNA ligase|nr:RNA 2',3'-cyclic phosphodiesterase [Oscillospiraceae bacterium]
MDGNNNIVQMKGKRQKLRLFVAILLNDPVKDGLCQAIHELENAALRGNFTRRENLHLTLAFLGETSRWKDILQAMEKVNSRLFPLVVQGLGKFQRGAAGIYWAGIQKSPQLIALQSNLCRELSLSGFSLEQRAYQPHLTLGREVILREDFEEAVFQKSVPPLSMEVRGMSLMRSERIDGRLVYTEVDAKQFD